MTKMKPEALTPEHVKAARALLKWSAADLSQCCNVGVATVRLMESGGNVRDSSRAAIMETLESYGVLFSSKKEKSGVMLMRFKMLLIFENGEIQDFGTNQYEAHTQAQALSNTRGKIIVESHKLQSEGLFHRAAYANGKIEKMAAVD